MFAVCVTFRIQPGHFDRFLARMLQQSKDSLELEAGCHRFDVCHNAADTVFLYELYSDLQAFEIHVASEHFKDFDRTVAPMIESKSVQNFDQVSVGE